MENDVAFAGKEISGDASTADGSKISNETHFLALDPAWIGSADLEDVARLEMLDAAIVLKRNVKPS